MLIFLIFCSFSQFNDKFKAQYLMKIAQMACSGISFWRNKELILSRFVPRAMFIAKSEDYLTIQVPRIIKNGPSQTKWVIEQSSLTHVVLWKV